MNKLITGAIILMAIQCLGQTPAGKKFTIQGDVSKINEPIEWVYITYPSGSDGSKKDSVEVKKGKYLLSGSIDEPSLVRLWISYPIGPDGKRKALSGRRDVAAVFLEPGTL